MADIGEFPLGEDSTHVLKLLDAAARCSICYSIFDAPLSLRACGHSFCSACIRQNLGFQEKSGDPQCPSCRAPCDARDLQPNVSLRELAEKYSSARHEIMRLIVQEKQQQGSLTAARAAEAAAAVAVVEAPPARKKARKDPPSGAVENVSNAPRRSSRRSAAGRAAEAAKKQNAKDFAPSGGGTTMLDDDDSSLPGPSTRSRAHIKDPPSDLEHEPQTDGVEVENDDCIEILSDADEKEEEGAKVKEERSVDHDEDFDLTLETEEEEIEEDDDEEFSPSPPLKKQRSKSQQQKQPPAGVGGGGGGSGSAGKPAAGAPVSTPQGFVPCPICAKSVPSFYINSHVDSCLNSGGSGGGGGSEEQDGGINTATKTPIPPPSFPPQPKTATLKSNLAPKPPQGPFNALAVPPTLIPALASEKIIRTALKKYSLPSDGKKPEMFERYSQFRFAVLTANDRQERTSYTKIAQRVVAQERQRAAAALLGGGGGGGNSSLGRLDSVGGVRNGSTLLINQNKLQNNINNKRIGDPTVLQGDSFEELIAVTKARDAARRAARATAATAEEGQKAGSGSGDPPVVNKSEDQAAMDEHLAAAQTEAEDDDEEKEEQPGLSERSPSPPHYNLPSPTYNLGPSPLYPPLLDEEKANETIEINAAAAVPAMLNGNTSTREEMLAEEVRQAHEVGLLDSDDDNW